MTDHSALAQFLSDVGAASSKALAGLDTTTPTPTPVPTPDPTPDPPPPPAPSSGGTEVLCWSWDSAFDHVAWKAAGGGGVAVHTHSRVGTGFPTNYKPMSDAFHAAGLRSYFACYLENYAKGQATPLGDIWDDTIWAANVAWLVSFATQVVADGWDGWAWDAENYPVETNAIPSWSWKNAAQGHTEAETRAKMRARGTQVGTALAVRTTVGGKRLVVYGSDFSAGLPGGWNEQLQLLPGNSQVTYAESLWVDFLAGLFSAMTPETYLLSGWCETGPQGPGSFDAQLAYDRDGQLATAKARFPAALIPKLGFGAFYSCGPVDAVPAKSVSAAVAQMQACAHHADGLIVEYYNKGSAASPLSTYAPAYAQAAAVSSGLTKGIPAGPLVNPRG